MFDRFGDQGRIAALAIGQLGIEEHLGDDTDPLFRWQVGEASRCVEEIADAHGG